MYFRFALELQSVGWCPPHVCMFFHLNEPNVENASHKCLWFVFKVTESSSWWHRKLAIIIFQFYVYFSFLYRKLFPCVTPQRWTITTKSTAIFMHLNFVMMIKIKRTQCLGNNHYLANSYILTAIHRCLCPL